MYRFDPFSKEYERVYEGPRVGGFTIQKDGSLLLFLEQCAIRTWTPDQGFIDEINPGLPGEAESRFNDVVADPEGRVYCGSMPPEGNLYLLDTDGSISVVLENVQTSNGLGFDPDLRKLYHAETGAETVWQFDYDRSTGQISDKTAFVDTSDEPGNPDGLTVDREGYVWICRWNGGWVTRHHPEDGTVTERVELPAKKVTSITFGGVSSDEAYVTTAVGKDGPDDEGNGAGALFRLRDLPAPGKHEYRSRISL
jgi:D-xylonolactonase